MKTIDYKKVDMTDGEYDYYLQLVNKFTDADGNPNGSKYFQGTFDTDEHGYIVLIKTEKSIPWAVLFFIQQLMINQRMRANDKLIKENKELIEKLKELEIKLNRS